MFIIVSKGTERRRVEIPYDIERDGEKAMAAFCKTVKAWDDGEPVGAHWPFPELILSNDSASLSRPSED